MGTAPTAGERHTLIGLVALVLGGGDAVVAAIGGPIGYVLLIAALPVAWRGRVSGVAGLLVGFGMVWLLLFARQFASGGRLSDPLPWLAIGGVPLVIGLALAVVGMARAR